MPVRPLTHPPAGEPEIRALYADILRCWNERNAGEFARHFSRTGNMVGFDGSPVDGQVSIEEHLTQVFRSHPTAAYIGKVREVRLLSPGVVLLRAVAGMVPPGTADLKPEVNTIHTLVGVFDGHRWRVELFQSTPAAFHGRPAAVEALTAELRKEMEQHPV
jgi:uncharacterized protein (TIGR02246 family)